MLEKEVAGHMDVLPGESDDVHEQCRQLYGNGSFMCVSLTRKRSAIV